jgi:hypothetical protein
MQASPGHAPGAGVRIMDLNKRNFITQVITWAVTAPALLAGVRAFAQFQGQQQAPQSPMPAPPAPGALPPFPDIGPKIDEKKILKQNDQQIHDDVEKLYELASELKKEVEKTNSAVVLSLPMMQKAEQIEKLAKQVKNLARGN